MEFFKNLSFKLRISLICGIGVLTIMLLHFGLYDMIMNFVLVGAIPGTHISIPYWVMLLFYGIIALNLVIAIENATQRPLPPKDNLN